MYKHKGGFVKQLLPFSSFKHKHYIWFQVYFLLQCLQMSTAQKEEIGS